MPLLALTDKADIEDAMHRLARTLSRGATKPYLVIETPGGGGTRGEPVSVLWHQAVELWAYLDIESEGRRYWCPFGVVSPAVAPAQVPVVQINSPVADRDFHTQGAFARDARRNLYYLHTGGVARGALRKTDGDQHQQAGSKSFVASGPWKGERSAVVWPDGASRDMYVVGQLDHDSFVTTLAAYVHAALQFRLLVMGQTPPIKPQRTIFLSHSNAGGDRQWCDAFVSILRGKGRDVWFDQLSMTPGILSEQFITQIARRDGFVLALSRSALASQNVRQEIEWAMALLGEKGQPRIMPVRLDDSEVPPDLDQFVRIRGAGDVAMSPTQAAHEVDLALNNWERTP